MDVKRKLITATSNVRKKFKELKRLRAHSEQGVAKHWQPLISPLKEIVEKFKSEATKKEVKEEEPEDVEKEEGELDDSSSAFLKDEPTTVIRQRTTSSHPEFEQLAVEENISPPEIQYKDTPRPSTSFLKQRFEETYSTPLKRRRAMSWDERHRQMAEPMDPNEDIRAIYRTPEGREQIENSLQNFGPLAQQYMQLFFTDTGQATESTFGVRHDGGDLKIGNSTVGFDEDDNILVDGKVFKGTKGLYNLMFLRAPEDYDNEDIQRYGMILKQSNAHRVNNDPHKRIKYSGGIKYKTVIAKMFPSGVAVHSFGGTPARTGTPKQGAGSGLLRTFTTTPIQFEYWTDPNELVERLQLLHAEKYAGNTAPELENEIISIVTQLRKAHIIA